MKSAAFNEAWLEARLAKLLPDFPDVSLCVALSGGLDSVTLLAALAAMVKNGSSAGSRGASAFVTRRARGSAARRGGGSEAPRGGGSVARRGGDSSGSAGFSDSGGLSGTPVPPDSAASSAARRLRASSLRAIHIHHGLHANADKWSAHCSRLASRLRVPLEIIKVRVPRARGGSLEAAARDARYAALAGALRPNEVLLTAHHQDDQLETVLLQLLRGAGVPGLAAMPEVAPFAHGRLARPLLTRSRVDLEEWASAHDLTWIDDDTNIDERFDRNYLRHTVLPRIRERWPGAGAAVSRTARHAAEARRLLDALALADVERASIGAALSVQRLRALDSDRRRNALRFWIARAGFTAPDTRRLDELAGPLLDARADANPQVRWNDVIVGRHADILSIRVAQLGPNAVGTRPLAAPTTDPASEAPADAGRAADAAELLPRATDARSKAADSPGAVVSSAQVWNWRESSQLTLAAPFAGTLSIVRDRHGPLDLDKLSEKLTVQGRHGGETLRPAPGARTRRLKSLLQEARVPPAQRESLPLVYADGKLIAVADRWLDASVHATVRTRHRARLRFALKSR